jgi:hypothetical protein
MVERRGDGVTGSLGESRSSPASMKSESLLGEDAEEQRSGGEEWQAVERRAGKGRRGEGKRPSLLLLLLFPSSTALPSSLPLLPHFTRHPHFAPPLSATASSPSCPHSSFVRQHFIALLHPLWRRFCCACNDLKRAALLTSRRQPGPTSQVSPSVILHRHVNVTSTTTLLFTFQPESQPLIVLPSSPLSTSPPP